MVFLEFVYVAWEATKPTIVLTDNKSVRWLFQTKALPPALWNACEYLLNFNFKIAHIAGSTNTATDFLSRSEFKVTEKIRLKNRGNIQTSPIEVTTSSSVVADDEQFFFVRQTMWVRRIISLTGRTISANAREWVANGEPSKTSTIVKEFTKLDGNATSYSMNGIKANARIQVEQDVDPVLKNLNLKILAQPDDEVLQITDNRYKHYKINDDRKSPQRWPTDPELLPRNWYCQILLNSHTKTISWSSTLEFTRRVWKASWHC